MTKTSDPHYPTRTSHFRVEGAQETIHIISRLMVCSQWFRVLPLPADAWEIAVKVENKERMLKWLASLQSD